MPHAKRRFIRHPFDIPIQVSAGNHNPTAPHLRDVCDGGVSFHARQPARPGQRVHIRIELLQPPFEADGEVMWCEADSGGGYEIGVSFLSTEDAYRARMMEQICHIEQYRREVRASEGRRLSDREAALEWIERYAPHFPGAH